MSLADKVAEQQALLVDLGLADGPKHIAVDLGCGPGYQSFALANLGFGSILSIDTSRRLIAELETDKTDNSIKAVVADLLTFPDLVEPGSVNAILCMGDTLTHLESRADVSTLFLHAYNALAADGRLVLTFRDFSTELCGLERFIPVQADDDRIMTCAVDYEPETVVVTDLIHVRNGNEWTLHKSSYQKLRLIPAMLESELQEIGFVVDQNRFVGRMHAIVARK